MRAWSLRAELTRASLLTTLVALLLSAGSLLVYELFTYRGGLVDDLQAQADLIAHSTSAALVFNDPHTASENLALLRQKPGIRAAAVFGRDGARFAEFAVDGTAPHAIDEALAEAGARLHGSTVEIAYPVMQDGERVGMVYLRGQHDLWDRALSYTAILAAVTAVSLALAHLVFGGLQRKITEPLLRMTEVAQDVMTKRDWTLRAPQASNADVEVLVRAFNGMLAEVEQRTSELELEMIERRHVEAELKQLDRRKDEFLATLAHELRNPLAPMSSALQLMRAPRADAAARDKSAAILERQIRQMVRLIDDLLDVSRVTTGKLSLHRASMDLSSVLAAAVEIAEGQAKLKRQTLTLEMPPRPVQVSGDSARLAQVFSNLLNNASRYTPAGGRIEVVLRTENGQAVIDVRDNGIGIAPEMQLRIFELFEQVDKSLERGGAGLGIGLTLARQLVQLHGGELGVKSLGLGTGSCFTVRLPLPTTELQEAAAPPPPAAPGQPLDILVADDNVDFASSMADMLGALGHRVSVVHDGLAALRAAVDQPPDVALLDIGMPGLNGYDVARRLRADARTAELRLIAITGWGQPSDREQAKQAGFDHHMVKPVELDRLLDVLQPH